VEYVSPETIRDKETEHLKLVVNDPMCLNLSPTGYDKTDIKPVPERIAIENKYKTVNHEGFVYKGSKPISKFTKEGVFVETYISIADAAKRNNTHAKKIREVLSGRAKTHHGLIYKYA